MLPKKYSKQTNATRVTTLKLNLYEKTVSPRGTPTTIIITSIISIIIITTLKLN